LRLNSRERFRRTMAFQKVDHPPFREFVGFWEETVNRWYREGLPTWICYGGEGLGHATLGLGALTDYFGLEKEERIQIDFEPIPRFPRKTLEETERFYIEVDELGIKKTVMKTGTTVPRFIENPVKTREDFEKIKKRFNPRDLRRYPKAWSEELIEHYRNLGIPVEIKFPGFFGQGRTWMGLKNFLLAFFRDPKFIHEMFDFWADFLIETMRPVVEAKVLDYVHYWEDMCYKNGPHISPSHFREFMLPYYKRVSDFLKRNGVDVIMVDTDGDANLLVPLFLEGGVNCLFPLEVQAGMDAVGLRREYGQRLRLIGNIDKRALVEGEEAIERELDAKLPQLLREGGYIPSLDHNVPVDVPYRNYLYYLKLLKKHLGIE